MVNQQLMKAVSVDELIAMGFVEENDGSNDPRGVDWNMRTEKFHILIDPWFEVKLMRQQPDSDPITVHVTDKSELQTLIDWIKD